MNSIQKENYDKVKRQFSRWIKSKVAESGMTQEQVAGFAGVSQAAIEGYISGRSVPRLDIYIALLNVFNQRIEIVEGKG